MVIDCISDLHGYYPTLQGGDLLIVAGDCTSADTMSNWHSFNDWLCEQQEKYKETILIAGNHDTMLQEGEYPKSQLGAIYLCDSGTEFEGLKIWGSPWSKTFTGMNPKCKAFTVDTEEELTAKWKLIPDDIDILVTHSPPYGMFDEVKRQKYNHWEHTGSTSLLSRWMVLNAKVHIFGHIHEGYGILTEHDEYYVNASHVDENYKPVNAPIRIEF